MTTDRIEWSPDSDAWPMSMTLHIADLIRFNFSYVKNQGVEKDHTHTVNQDDFII